MKCPRCGRPLPTDAAEGLCPTCLMARAASQSGVSDSEATTVLSPHGDARTAARDASRLTPGQTFGPYRVERLLGRGGMGEVYEAEHLDQGRRVALKVLSQRLTDASDRARFLREGQLAASISHPNTVYIFGSEEIEGVPTIAMELVAGGTLKSAVAHGGPMTPAAAVDAILGVIAGLDAAQAAGILHRDVKPSNCFVDADGAVKVGDFGLSISTLARDVTTLTTTGTFQGTPAFAAPEQLRGEPLDMRADIYAVGATLYYLLTGRPPFDDPDLLALVARVATEAPPSPHDLCAAVPRALARVVLRCLAKARSARPANYAALDEELRPFGSAAARPATVGKRFMAGVVDMGLILVITTPLGMYIDLKMPRESLAQFYPSRDLPLQAIWLLYFTVLEGRWGAGIGKRLFGIHVIDLAGQPPGLVRALARGVLFSLLRWVAFGAVATWGVSHVGWLSVIEEVLASPWLSFAIMFSTARRRNGFAGLHDLVSETRVVEVRTRAVRADREPPAIRADAADLWRHRVGPYGTAEPIGAAGRSSVLRGFDARLRRQVWIHALSPGAPVLTPLMRDLGRPGRLRWLSGFRSVDTAWDAYEAPGGVPLTTLTGAPQPWSVVKYWLMDLSQEIEAGLRDGSLTVLALDRVWITSGNRAMLLDFQPPGVPEGSGPHKPPDLPSAQAFLGEVARVALDGPPGVTRSVGRAAPPPPLQAQALLAALADRGVASGPQLTARVGAVLGTPDRVPRWRRGVHLALCSVPPLMQAGVLAFVMVMIARATPPQPERAQPAPQITASVALLASLPLIAGVGLLSAFIGRGGLLLGALGMAVVTGRGARVGRRRALARALIAWSPLGPMCWAGLTNHTAIFAVAAVVFAMGVAWVAVVPERGLQDRMAGTWVVPR